MSFLRLARSLFLRRHLEDDLDEEIRSHFELIVDQNVASGMDDQAARRAARLEAGGVDQIKDAIRDVRAGARLEQLWRDARLAIRRLIQAPLAVSAIVGTLLVGLGTFAVVYTVVQKILLDPMPYRDPDDLYFVWRDYGRIIDMSRGSLAGTDVAELQKTGGAIDGAVGLWRQLGTLSVREGADPIEIGVMLASPNLFELLGAVPVLGRSFAPSEVGPGRPPVIVLTHELWNRLGADAAIVGTDVRLNGRLYRVIGVMPASFASCGPPKVSDRLNTSTHMRRSTYISPILGVLLGLLAATAPALWAARASMSSLLAASAMPGGGGHGRLRRTMVVAQVALSLVLLSSGGLVARSFDRLVAADPGFRPAGLLTFRLPMPSALFPEVSDVLALQNRIEEAFAAIPEVTGASAADALPLTANSTTGIAIPRAPGNTGSRDRDWPVVDYIGARAGYVEVMGMRLRAGRRFSSLRHDGVREALIDSLLARQFFPGGSPLGTRILFRDGSVTIVGVVDQPRLYDVHQDGRPQLFVRAEDWGYRSLSFVVRTRREPQLLIADVRSAIRRIEPPLAIAEVRTMDEIVRDTLRQQRMSAVVIIGLASGALLLAAMGLVSVVSGSVTRRRHELALRIALGAGHQRVLRLVLAEGARLVGLGVIIGLPGIYVAGRLIRGVLVGSPNQISSRSL